ncbi:hypothetical protein MYAM1_002876 [Malassezia yamatoensis]|uniref:HMG box domain-containing protein n=1 Tax=Malassezia yamatoensis TaxID=253288 RepID=A0AAJ5YTJ0_9BASI|nr:hypothetical protein MYAM1_002876 [Malassezia yamatoensis]
MLLNRLFVGLAAQALFQRVAGTRSAPIARAPLSTSALVKLAKNTNQPAVKAKATSKTTRQSSTATTKKSKADVTAGATAKAEKAKNLAEKKEKAKQKKLQQELAKKEKKEKEKAKALALKEKEKALALKEKEKALAQKQKEKARKEKEKAKELAKKEKASKAKTPKDKPWELRDADGKLVPLPMATKPKRKTSFLLYFAERFTQLKHLDEYLKTSPSTGKQIPDLTAMSTSVAKEWKELPDAQRAEFEKKVAEQKAQYEKDLEAWRESLTPEDIRRQNLYYSHQRKTGKAAPSNLRDPNMPKRPLGAFFSFVQEQREAKTLSGSVIEQSRQAADMWKSMSAEKRQAYEKASTQQIEEYMQAMEEYKARNQIA